MTGAHTIQAALVQFAKGKIACGQAPASTGSTDGAVTNVWRVGDGGNLLMAVRSTETIGTTVPIYIPMDSAAAPVRPESGYFRIRIAAAQAAIFGPAWQQVVQLVVTSNVTLNCPPFGSAPLRSIHRVRELRKNAAVQLGLSADFVELTPAIMERLTIAVDFLLDTRNRFAVLAKLVNDDAFLSVISLAPGAAAVAKQVTNLADRIVSTFTDPGAQQPLLHFIADYSLPVDDLREGYYVIFGSRYEKHPLPRPLPTPSSLHFQDGELLHDGKPVTQWSYIILEVNTVPARGTSLGRGEAWYEKLQSAQAQAEAIASNPFARKEQRRSAWDSCEILLREMSVLLQTSPLYLPNEVRAITQTSYVKARSLIFPIDDAALGAPPALAADTIAFLGVSDPAELAAAAANYSKTEARAQDKLRKLGLLS